MNIHHERTVETEVGVDELRRRMERWAERTGFRSINATGNRWVYRRGSWWSILYSFNIRKWPTTLIVEARDDTASKVYCSIQCKFWLTAPLPDDSLILQDDLESLVARLCERHPSPLQQVIEEEER